MNFISGHSKLCFHGFPKLVPLYQAYLILSKLSQYSVWLRAGRPGDLGSIPGRGETIFPLASVQTNSGANPESCPVGTRGPFPGGKAQPVHNAAPPPASSASRPGRAFTPGERTPGTHCTGGWVGPRAGMDTEDRGKILYPRRGSNPDRPVVQPVVRHYTA
jgi:hypothetical protein